ncbi:hypothetical protein DACRYDRAFT_109112 [Dacryopinax primogenitus]|uniref:Uncharacterized protein n=1 Tax=Dacryopinax primogenitus (strain DJM 731) TaxID=1858805 RepID=M5G9B5_DACPD|nr:uncharacterized protein DACRYDRAFT_109112 [Dacryopinax primogenitus]EJU00383.1 hypothetical protein DACRYDRAFT_109112 [Dacryopinax primogenitus]
MAKPSTCKSAAKPALPTDEHAIMLKTAAAIIAHMCKDTEDPRFLLLVKYSDVMPFSNVVVLLLNSPQSTLQEELATLSAPPEEDEEEDEDEKEFKAMLSGFLTSLVSLASPLVKAKKGKTKTKETTPAKVVMLCLDDGTNVTLPVTKVHGRPTKKDSCNAKLMCMYLLAKPNKCKREEDNKDEAGPLHKWSHLPEAGIEPPVMLLHMAEHNMLELQKSLLTAQKAVDAVQKVVDTISGWVEQVQTLLGRALAE